jgi:hypothetical protein
LGVCSGNFFLRIRHLEKCTNNSSVTDVSSCIGILCSSFTYDR